MFSGLMAFQGRCHKVLEKRIHFQDVDEVIKEIIVKSFRDMNNHLCSPKS